MSEWRSVKDDPPEPWTRVLTLMKHGVIEGEYDPERNTFGGYYWRDMEWFATHWMPLPKEPVTTDTDGGGVR